MDLWRLRSLVPRNSDLTWLYLRARSILAALGLHEGNKRGAKVPRSERGRACVRACPPKAKRKTSPCFIYSVIEGASLCHSCWARAANSVEMKFQPSVCFASPAHCTYFSLCLCLISPFVVKRYPGLWCSLTVGNHSGNFWIMSEEMNRGACLGWRHKTDHAFIVTAGFMICCALLIYAYSFLFQHIKKNMPI